MIDWNKKLRGHGVRLLVRVHTPSGTVDRAATLRDLRQMIADEGLEVTASEVDWRQDYPGRSAHINRICLLQQRVSDLRYRLRHRPRTRLSLVR
jgi:hypothetical protein